MSSILPLVVCLMGPTATGKTALALALSEHLPLEVISVDSALVYRGMDIGSAKPSAQEMARVPHHLIDVRDPLEPYSAAAFRSDALTLIDEIHARGRTPLLVGGTMLYFKALIEGLAPLPESDPDIRRALEQEAAQRGWPAMHQRLKLVDPVAADNIHPNHSQRICRALEVHAITGRPLTQWWQEQRPGDGVRDRFNLVQIALAPQNRALLHERIERRFADMLAGGFIEEVRSLRDRGDLHIDLPSMRAVGYRQVWEFLDGQYGSDELVARGCAATRQLAKRQLTWLRGWDAVSTVWIDDAQGLPRNFHEMTLEVLNLLPQTPL